MVCIVQSTKDEGDPGVYSLGDTDTPHSASIMQGKWLTQQLPAGH